MQRMLYCLYNPVLFFLLKRRPGMLMNFKQFDENVNEWLCTLMFAYCLY